jgi:hypothetical protein
MFEGSDLKFPHCMQTLFIISTASFRGNEKLCRNEKYVGMNYYSIKMGLRKAIINSCLGIE